MAASHDSYSKLAEPIKVTDAANVPIAALTATATKLTRDKILNLLCMENAAVIKSEQIKCRLCCAIYG